MNLLSASSQRIAPGFIGIGVQKAGTTWLDNVLREHPQIWMPPIKELHFFDDFYRESANKGLDRYVSKNMWVRNRWRRNLKSVTRFSIRYPSFSNIKWAVRYLGQPLSYDWYSRLFEGQTKLTGEVTPAYSTLTLGQIKEVAEMCRTTKILVMLRNPVERAWSHCRMELFARLGREVEEVSEGEIRNFLFHDEAVLARSNYSTILENWSQTFGQERVFVGLLDEVKSEPTKLAQGVFQFLGVESASSRRIETAAKKVVYQGKDVPMSKQIHEELRSFYKYEIEHIDKLLPHKDIKSKWLI